jgi:cellobiose phosphorylase
MYRVAIEDVLGFHLHEGHSIRLRPRLPSTWDHATLRYRDPHSQSVYEIRIERDRTRPGGILTAVADGKALVSDQGEIQVPLLRDGAMHAVKVVLGA